MTEAEQKWSLIEGLEYCKNKRRYDKSCAKCPYAGLGCGIDAAIEKLKAQEATKPIWIDGGVKTIGHFECGKCGANMGTNPKYCWFCGRAVKWE